MSKHRTKTRSSHEEQPKTVSVELPLPLLSALTGARESVMDLCIHTGLEVLGHMMEEDRVELCGAAHRHVADRKAYRGGMAPGEITLGGAALRCAAPEFAGPSRERSDCRRTPGRRSEIRWSGRSRRRTLRCEQGRWARGVRAYRPSYPSPVSSSTALRAMRSSRSASFVASGPKCS